jgi:hypothetical protein
VFPFLPEKRYGIRAIVETALKGRYVIKMFKRIGCGTFKESSVLILMILDTSARTGVPVLIIIDTRRCKSCILVI